MSERETEGPAPVVCFVGGMRWRGADCNRKRRREQTRGQGARTVSEVGERGRRKDQEKDGLTMVREKRGEELSVVVKKR